MHGKPLSARAHELRDKVDPSILKACVIIKKGFKYLDFVNIKIASEDNKPSRHLQFMVTYNICKPYCHRCEGYGHWSSLYSNKGSRHSSTLCSAHLIKGFPRSQRMQVPVQQVVAKFFQIQIQKQGKNQEKGRGSKRQER